MHEGDVDDASEVPLHGADVVRCVVSVRLPRLGEQIHDQDAAAATGGERFPHSARKHAGDDAGVQAARTEHDQVCVRDRLQGAGRRGHRALQCDPVNSSARPRDGRFAADQASIGEPADELDAPIDGRKDLAANPEERAGDLDRGAEVAEPLGESGEDHVTDGVTTEAAVALEPVLEQVCQGVLASGERDEAVADVARARQPVAPADLAGASAVVARRDDPADLEVDWACVEQREAAEEGGKTGPAAHGDDAQGRSALRRDRAKSAHDLFHGSSCGEHGCLTAA